MTRLQVEVEGGPVCVDLVEHDVIGRAFLDEDIEAVAAGFVGDRFVSVFLD